MYLVLKFLNMLITNTILFLLKSLPREGRGRLCVKGRPVGLLWRRGLAGVLPPPCD
jgi:hypothetical protein